MKGGIARFFAVGVAICIFAGCTRGAQDWCCIRDRNAYCDYDALFQDICLPEGPLELTDILAIAFDRNIDLYVKERELAVQQEIATGELFKMLPSLTVSGELSGRDAKLVETSKDVTTGTVSAGSIAREPVTNTFEATLAWSLLDFGLSYYRSRQERNRELMICLEHRRTRQNLIFDIIREYWKGVVARRAIDGASHIIEAAHQRQLDLQKQIDRRVISEIEGLRHEDRLLAIQIELQSFEREYRSALAELGQLMGLPPGVRFELATDVNFDTEVVLPEVEDLEEMALHTRPELFAQDVQEAIMVDEVRAAFLQMFPNTTLFTSYNYDGDIFLLHNDWVSAGIKATVNLLQLPQHWANKNAACNRVRLVRESRLQLSIGVMTQVRLSYLRYMDAIKQNGLSDQLHGVKSRLFESAQKEKTFGIIHGVTILDYEVDALFAEINTLRTHAEIQVALEQINNAMGIPLQFNNFGFEGRVKDLKLEECPSEEEAAMFGLKGSKNKVSSAKANASAKKSAVSAAETGFRVKTSKRIPTWTSKGVKRESPYARIKETLKRERRLGSIEAPLSDRENSGG